MSTAQSRLESLLEKHRSVMTSWEIAEQLEQLSQEFGEPKATHGEIRRMLDHSLGERRFSSEVRKMREDRP